MRCALLPLLLYAGVAGATSNAFQLGVDAFKQGHYETAAAYFTAAHSAGVNTPALFFNLGSTQFKLGDYAAASESFAHIANDPDWGALAQYNLGLVAERLNDPVGAEQHYRAAFEIAQSDKLKQLAAAKLSVPTAQPTSDNWYGIASLAGGYDDNVVLLNDQSLTSVTHKEDYFAEALASASGYVSGDINRGWRTDLSAYYRGYTEQTDYDYGVASAGIAYSRIVDGSQWQLGGKTDAQFVGGDPYLIAGTLRGQWLRPIGSISVRVRNDVTYVDGASNFGYLTGWQDRLGVQFYGKRLDTYLRVGYELELNDRRDDTTPTEFFSYSPTWNRFYATLSHPVSDALDVDLRVEYQFSRYRDKNVQTNPPGGALQEEARDDDRFTTSLRATYHAFAQWNVFGEYFYANNSSNFKEYEYENKQFVVGVERPF
jgi:hypothetical protein